MEFGSESTYEFTVNSANNQGIDNYNWVVGGGTILEGQGTNAITVKTVKVTGTMNKYFDVSVRVHGCDWGPYLWRTGYVTSGIGPPQFVIYPNPASSEVTVSVSDAASLLSKSATEDVEIKTVDIVDFYGNRLKVANYGKGQKSASVNISGFQKGTYLVIVNNGTTKEKHTLVVE